MTTNALADGGCGRWVTKPQEGSNFFLDDGFNSSSEGALNRDGSACWALLAEKTLDAGCEGNFGPDHPPCVFLRIFTESSGQGLIVVPIFSSFPFILVNSQHHRCFRDFTWLTYLLLYSYIIIFYNSVNCLVNVYLIVFGHFCSSINSRLSVVGCGSGLAVFICMTRTLAHCGPATHHFADISSSHLVEVAVSFLSVWHRLYHCG